MVGYRYTGTPFYIELVTDKNPLFECFLMEIILILNETRIIKVYSMI